VFVAEDGFVPIGELARRTGVATSALRYYERIGLLSPARRAGGKRHYTPSSAAKKLINHALECPHRDLLTCPRFRSALEAQLEHPGPQRTS
jgi:DNA-binding transcriptional MerR regulator